VDEPDPGFAMPIADLAFAPSGELFAIAVDGEVRRRAGGAWTLHSNVGATGLLNLIVGATGELYAATRTTLYYFDAGTWEPLVTYFAIGDLDVDASGTTIVASSEGVEELHAGVRTKTFVTGFAFDAVALGETYFVASLAPARFAAERRPVYASGTASPLRARRMPDGSVLGWESDVFELGPILGPEFIASAVVRGIVGSSGSIQWYTNDHLLEYSNAPTVLFNFPSTISHVTAAGERVYIAMSNHVAHGKGGAYTIEPTGARSIWGDEEGNMAKVATNGSVHVRRADQDWQQLPPSACLAVRIYGFALDELYVVRDCAMARPLERWDGAGWTTVYPSIFGGGHPLGDGTLAFAGSPVVIGRGTTWTAMPFSATTVSGTSANDLFLGGTTVGPTEALKLGHWDGTTVAKIRYPGEDENKQLGYDLIYGDATTLVMSNGDELLAFGRFPVP